ncbi:hypothetical protein I6N95_15590 [Vagococcus sp. BWB3-3]|uniref:Uncharacterized protein n=1 Tax=Vagococcus allomyrinae TaxID=2794353 RepID=A0A940PF88_9ENTE|nr:hypothetical protein [Vagococcus allomyrinae]MBP1042441.1 hypothetical protein [Vagococcus allomyrinae]
MIIWEGNAAEFYFNVPGSNQLQKFRMVHLPKEPDPEKLLKALDLFATIMPKGSSRDSVVVVNRTRYI